MKVELLPIAKNRKRYFVYAYFENNNGVKYRRFADIVRNGHVEDDIDAYIIMINPGSCHEKSNENPIKNTLFYKEFEMVETVSDMAQKCVMSLMDVCKMNKIRILNLTDYVGGNFDKVLKDKDKWGESVFSEQRTSELERYMPTKAVCIASWGTNDKLRDIKEVAYNRLGAERIIGYVDDKNKFSYRYIKPRGIEKQKEVITAIAKEYYKYIKKSD